jgi:hypothetical protein
MLEVVRYNDDGAFAHYPLRMRITNLTLPHHFITDTRYTHSITGEYLDGIHKILYGCYAICDYTKRIIYKFLHSEILTWQVLEVLIWNDDDITHERMHMRVTNPTQPNPTQPNLTTFQVIYFVHITTEYLDGIS